MKQKFPPIPKPERVPNKDPGANAKIHSDKTMNSDSHLDSYQGKIKAVAAKNKGR